MITMTRKFGRVALRCTEFVIGRAVMTFVALGNACLRDKGSDASPKSIYGRRRAF